MSINGTLGNVAFYNNENIVLGKSACFFNLMDGINKGFIKIFIKSKYFIEYASYVASETTIKNVSLKSMRLILIPLPSLAEQGAIVAKVDMLMGHVSQLEEKIAQNSNNTEILMQAFLAEAFKA